MLSSVLIKLGIALSYCKTSTYAMTILIINPEPSMEKHNLIIVWPTTKPSVNGVPTVNQWEYKILKTFFMQLLSVHKSSTCCI